MDKKIGFHATTSMLALAALSGSAAFHANAAAAKDAVFTPEFSLEQTPDCGSVEGPCPVSDLALLSAPNNVIYKTRATVALPSPGDEAAGLTDQPRAATQGAFMPSNDKDTAD